MIRHEQGNESQPLLRPVALGALRLPNRVVMAPVTRCRATDPGRMPTDLHAAYYAQRATAGLIVSEGVWVSERAVGCPGVPGLYSSRQAAAWARVTGLVHALGGRIVAQLWHAGANSHPDHLGGAPPAGPSAIDPREVSPTPYGPKKTVTPREMTAADIGTAVADYAAAAGHARRAGFDGIEIAANGTYLIAQFLNPRLNRRTDGHGVRRERLLLEIVDTVADVWDGRGVGVRLSPYWTVADTSRRHQPRGACEERGERREYAYTADETTLAAYDGLVSALSERPVEYLHLRGRAPGAGGPDLAEIARYRTLFTGPLIANHGFDRATGNAVIDAGIADAVSYARLFIANPDLVSRFALGHDLAASDPSTHYTGGARGYVDYPAWPGAAPRTA